jgi:TPR repeat protein
MHQASKAIVFTALLAVAGVKPALSQISTPKSQGPGVLDQVAAIIDETAKIVDKGASADDQGRYAFFRYKNKPGMDALKPLAALAKEPGHHIASNYVGCIFGMGMGVPKDDNKAFAYFANAAAKYPLAAYNYGLGLSARGNNEKAKKPFEYAWDKGGHEQAGAWLVSMRLNRKEKADELVDELVGLQSPVGHFHLAKRLHAEGNFRDAAGKMGPALELGLRGANSLMASMFLAGKFRSFNKKFDLISAYSHLYIERSISTTPWRMPPLSEMNFSASYDKAWFGDMEDQMTDIKQQAHSRASLWFFGHNTKPTRYTEYLCEPNGPISRRVSKN